MTTTPAIPVFTLFGETEHFPDVIHCERVSARAPTHGWTIPAHRHAQMAQLFVITRGRVVARVDGMDAILTDAQFLFIPAQAAHQFTFDPQTEGWVFSLPLAVVTSIGPASREMTLALSRPLIGQTGPQLALMSDLLAEVSAGTGTFRAQAAVGLAHALMALIAEEAQAPARTTRPPSRTRLAALDQLIGHHLADGWTAASYAAALSITTGHLSRLCRGASGMGASTYIEHAAMAEACRLLAFTQIPVSEIGYRLGYDDPSYFSKRFRKVRKQAPSEYRAQFSG